MVPNGPNIWGSDEFWGDLMTSSTSYPGHITAVDAMEEKQRILQRRYQKASVAPISKPKHVCSETCKEEQNDFYDGIVTYHRLSNSKIVEEEKKICKSPKCLLARIKTKI